MDSRRIRGNAPGCATHPFCCPHFRRRPQNCATEEQKGRPEPHLKRPLSCLDTSHQKIDNANTNKRHDNAPGKKLPSPTNTADTCKYNQAPHGRKKTTARLEFLRFSFVSQLVTSLRLTTERAPRRRQRRGPAISYEAAARAENQRAKKTTLSAPKNGATPPKLWPTRRRNQQNRPQSTRSPAQASADTRHRGEVQSTNNAFSLPLNILYINETEAAKKKNAKH